MFWDILGEMDNEMKKKGTWKSENTENTLNPDIWVIYIFLKQVFMQINNG